MEGLPCRKLVAINIENHSKKAMCVVAKPYFSNEVQWSSDAELAVGKLCNLV
jgi:hypothetical protein